MPRQKTREESLGPYRRTRIRKRVQDQVDSIAEIIEPEEDEDDEGGELTPACGAGSRKETHQVTDRRLRQQAVECRPPDHVNSCVNWDLMGFAFD